MDLKELQSRAVEMRTLYSKIEKEKGGKEWAIGETMQAFAGDVGDLCKLVMAKEGFRKIEDLDEKLAHELADCLWVLLVIANKYNVPLEESFLKTMDDLEKRISE